MMRELMANKKGLNKERKNEHESMEIEIGYNFNFISKHL